MATSAQTDSDLKEIKNEMELALSTVKDIKSSQDSMRKSFDSKLDKMRSEFMTTLDGKIRTLKDELVMDMSKESGRTDQLEKTLQMLQTRLDNVEQSNTAVLTTTDVNNEQNGNYVNRSGNLENPDVCVTVSGVQEEEGKDLIEKAKAIISALGEEVSSHVVITGATRLRTHFQGKPKLMKISF